MLEFAGFEKSSLIDYPGQICTTLFTAGCNFRCPYCQNGDLIGEEGVHEGPDSEQVLAHLRERKGLVDGICLTGGEPTLAGGLVPFLGQVKELGFKVKLDTNGSRPELVRRLIGKGLIDYLAIDIKHTPERYAQACGREVEIFPIAETIRLFREQPEVAGEFRTTVVPGLHNRQSLIGIRGWLRSLDGEQKRANERYFLQQFRPDPGVLAPRFREKRPFESGVLKDFAAVLEPDFAVEIRGLCPGS